MPNARQLQGADPKASFTASEAAIRAAIDRVLASGHYILGAEVGWFESEFADYLGGGYSVGVGNGTDALEIALHAAGVRSGEIVATVANTVSATVSAIEQMGAIPAFIEIDRATMLMSPEALEAELTRGTPIRAVIPVHLYGSPADMPGIVEICEAHDVRVVEDCAQSHGAAIDGRMTGTFGDIAAFSFYPTKNLGALGDGGAVFTRDPDRAAQVRMLRQYGWITRYVSEIPGRNSRLDELQAAILRAKLPALDAENTRRRMIADRYTERLADSGLRLPSVTQGALAVWHQYAVRLKDREGLRAKLEKAGIICASLYPVPIHHQPAYLDRNVSLPVTEQACAEVLSLPCHPGVGLDDVERVCEIILR